MFHVPEPARILDASFRLASDSTFGNNGYFVFDSPIAGWRLSAIASDQAMEKDDPQAVGVYGAIPWEHVSVSAYILKPQSIRIPTWKEMCFIKDQFWDPEDVVMQLHPKQSEYVNCHPAVLHLWRPVGVEIPTPPPFMVGPKRRSDDVTPSARPGSGR